MSLLRLWIVLLALGHNSYGLGETQEISLSNSFGSQASFKNPGVSDLRLQYAEALTENFSTLYGYGYAQVHAQKNNWSLHGENIERESVDATLHSLLIGAQQNLGHSLFGWSGLTLASIRGSLNVDSRTGSARDFPYEAFFVYTETGFGQRWKIGESYGFGIDWLIFSIYFQRQLSFQSDELVRMKGQYYEPRREIKETIDQLTAIRTLGLRLCYFF